MLLNCHILNLFFACQSGKTPQENINNLLDILPRRGPHAFDVFVNALVHSPDTEIGEIASSLKDREGVY